MIELSANDRLALRDRPSSGAPVFPGKYLSITSFRRDGTGVATPVWFVQENGRLLVETDSHSYKVKRIRRTAWVKVAPCSATGRLHAEPVTALAEFLPDSEVARVKEMMARKYRFDLVFIKPIRFLQTALHLGREHGKPVILAITPL
jgi:PPOX class probable F420-dependent enzyme